MLGPAPILDFDGTIAVLSVDWPSLRRQLGVARIEDLWDSDDQQWSIVAAAEIEAAQSAEAVGRVVELLYDTVSFAVLTSNSSRAVYRFFERFPSPYARLAAVVGREELRGPKTNIQCFRSGLQLCLEATAAARGSTVPVYVGDADYELEFAADLGCQALDVAEISRTGSNERRGS